MAVNDKSPDPLGIGDGYSAAVHYEQSSRDQELYKNLYYMLTRAHDHRSPYERQWEIWRLFLKGIHLFRDRDSGEIVRVSAGDSKRLYSQNNQIRIVSRSLVGKLTAMIPTFRVTPATADPDEVYGGRAAEAWLQYYRRKECLDVLYTEMQKDLPWAGTSCCELYWDPEGGRRMAYCEETGELVPDSDLIGQPAESAFQMMQLELENKYQETSLQALQQGIPVPPPPPPIDPNEVPAYVEMYEGDLKVRHWDVRNVVVEPGVIHPKDLRYVFTVDRLPVTEIRRRFPHMAAFISAEQGSATERFSRNAIGSLDDAGVEDYLDDHALLITYHERATELYPKGRIVYMCNEFILDERESPYYKLGRLPFFFNWWERNPGEFWGEPFIAQAWHRQKELNAQETVEREYLELLARPKVLNPIGSRVSADEITATTGQVLKYNRAAGPLEYMPLPQLPPNLPDRKERLKMDIREMAAVTGSDVGQMPNDPNGRAMAIVSAEADQQLGPTLRMNHEEWRALNRGILILTKEYVDDQTKYSIGGQYAPMETYLLCEALDISAGWDLELELDDGLSRNQALRKNEALELVNAGLLLNPATGAPDMEKFARLSKIKMLEPGMDPDGAEQSSALMLIEKLIKNQPAEPQDEDDPMVFARVALNWLRKKGRKLMDAEPEKVQKVREMYQFYIQWAASMQAGQGMMPQGGFAGGGAQGPSQPGQPMTAPGGSPGSPVNTAAQGKVAMADKQAEGAAKTQPQHEG